MVGYFYICSKIIFSQIVKKIQLLGSHAFPDDIILGFFSFFLYAWSWVFTFNKTVLLMVVILCSIDFAIYIYTKRLQKMALFAFCSTSSFFSSKMVHQTLSDNDFAFYTFSLGESIFQI